MANPGTEQTTRSGSDCKNKRKNDVKGLIPCAISAMTARFGARDGEDAAAACQFRQFGAAFGMISIAHYDSSSN